MGAFPSSDSAALLRLDHVRDGPEVCRALRGWLATTQNFAHADSRGGIALVAPGDGWAAVDPRGSGASGGGEAELRARPEPGREPGAIGQSSGVAGWRVGVAGLVLGTALVWSTGLVGVVGTWVGRAAARLAGGGVERGRHEHA